MPVEMFNRKCTSFNTVRFLKSLVDLDYRVSYECYGNMLPLVKRSFPDVEIMPQAIDYPGTYGIPMFDYHTPISELPHILGTDIDTVPWDGPYLKPDDDLVRQYAEKLGGNPLNTKRVGLCWSAGIRAGMWISNYGKRKSTHYDDLKPLFFLCSSYDDLMWIPAYVSLQTGPERVQANLEDLLPKDEPSLDDTAALVANLDLVITVDTAVAHHRRRDGQAGVADEHGGARVVALDGGAPRIALERAQSMVSSVQIYRQKSVGEMGRRRRRPGVDRQLGHGAGERRL